MKRLLIALLLAGTAYAQPKIIQVTVGASTTRLSTTAVSCRWIVIQNNAANTMHIGDATTSSTAGIKLLTTGSFYQGALPSGGFTNLADWYVNGTQNDVIDVVCDVMN